MTDYEIALSNAATFTPSDKVAKELMLTLQTINPTYHWCLEWDGLVISDEWEMEFNHCECL